MILDKLAVFADAQTTTTSVASTDIVDTLAAGDAYVGDWFVARVDTAYTAGAGAPLTDFQLQTSTTEAFTAVITLAQSSGYLVASLTAGKIWAVRIPLGAKRYLRGYINHSNYNGATAFLSACATDLFITKDLTNNIQKRYALSTP